MTSAPPARLLIVQPYVPAYRVPLFQRLRTELSANGIDMRLAAAIPRGDVAARGDSVTAEVADFTLHESELRLGGKTLKARHLKASLRSFEPNYVILEQAIKNLETYPLLARRLATGSPRLALWGHGRSYSVQQSRVSAQLKQWLTRRGDWFFAYTETGAQSVVDGGFDPKRITVLRNTIDTEQLGRDLLAITEVELADWMAANSLTPGRTALFLGGVDAHKGIDFLMEAARELAERLPGFTLLVGGAGARVDAVRAQEQETGATRYLGRLQGRDKAMALRASDLMMVPEWVGLVAVDSLVAGCPIVTTDHPSHSPEFDYLRADSNCVVSEHSVAHVRAVEGLINNPVRLERIALHAVEDAAEYTMGGMAERFVHGVQLWRGEGTRPHPWSR